MLKLFAVCYSLERHWAEKGYCHMLKQIAAMFVVYTERGRCCIPLFCLKDAVMEVYLYRVCRMFI